MTSRQMCAVIIIMRKQTLIWNVENYILCSMFSIIWRISKIGNYYAVNFSVNDVIAHIDKLDNVTGILVVSL